jgi:predicted Ser/Thr protein kinase
VFAGLNVTDDEKMPQLLVYDRSFTEIFRIDGKEMKEDFEQALTSRLTQMGVLS